MTAILWLYNLAGVQQCALRDVTELIIEDRFQDSETLKFKVQADDPLADFIQADALVGYGDRRWSIASVVQVRGKAGASMVAVTAEGRWTELGKVARVGSYSILGATIAVGLDSILFQSGWTVGAAPASSDLYSLDDTDATVLSLIRRWSAITGTEIVWDTVNRTVSLVAVQGEDNGVGFRYARNLTEITRRVEPPIATRLYAYGANNLNMSTVNPAGFDYIEDYSWYVSLGLTVEQARSLYRKDQIWVDDRYLQAINLYDAAVARLTDLATPRISYECKVLDLYSLGLAAAPVAIGDTVNVYDSVFGLDLATRVVRIVRRPNEPWKDQIELSFLQKVLSDTTLTTGTRSPNYDSVAILVDSNNAALTYGSGFQSFARITITVAGETTAILGGAFRGVASGTGTIRFEVVIDLDPQPPLLQDVVFTAGQVVNFSWPDFASGIAEGTHLVEWRARVVSGSGTVDLAAGDGRGWLMAKGALGVGAATSPNNIIDETIAVPTYSTISASTTITIGTGADVSASTSAPYTLLVVTDSGAVTTSSGVTVTTITFP